MMSRAPVTGAAGFIGLHLAARPGVRLPRRTPGASRPRLCGARQNGMSASWWSA